MNQCTRSSSSHSNTFLWMAGSVVCLTEGEKVLLLLHRTLWMDMLEYTARKLCRRASPTPGADALHPSVVPGSLLSRTPLWHPHRTARSPTGHGPMLQAALLIDRPAVC